MEHDPIKLSTGVLLVLSSGQQQLVFLPVLPKHSFLVHKGHMHNIDYLAFFMDNW
jgi:hypothetical protein